MSNPQKSTNAASWNAYLPDESLCFAWPVIFCNRYSEFSRILRLRASLLAAASAMTVQFYFAGLQQTLETRNLFFLPRWEHGTIINDLMTRRLLLYHYNKSWRRENQRLNETHELHTWRAQSLKGVMSKELIC